MNNKSNIEYEPARRLFHGVPFLTGFGNIVKLPDGRQLGITNYSTGCDISVYDSTPGRKIIAEIEVPSNIAFSFETAEDGRVSFLMTDKASGKIASKLNFNEDYSAIVPDYDNADLIFRDVHNSEYCGQNIIMRGAPSFYSDFMLLLQDILVTTQADWDAIWNILRSHNSDSVKMALSEYCTALLQELNVSEESGKAS